MIRSPAVVETSGWASHNIWQHSKTVRDLYTRRANNVAEEMTCAAQAATILSQLATHGDSLLDVGCGSGYFFHSLQKRKIEVDYFGIDATEDFVRIGREALPNFGLPAERLQTLRVEDFQGSADHVLCMNVLSNIDNYHRPLERLLQAARKSVILRESIKTGSSYSYVRDEYLDPGVELNVHVNAYDRAEITSFMTRHGFAVEEVLDQRSEGRPEIVIGHPHWWTFLVATRTNAR